MASAADAASPTTVRGSNSQSNGPSAQRIKKREVDRRCQRLARERTKTRLAQLEALVEDFRRKDEDGQVARLMQQIEDLTADKDKLIKTLRSIRNALNTGSDSEDEEQAENDANKQATAILEAQQNANANANIITTSNHNASAQATSPIHTKLGLDGSVNLSNYLSAESSIVPELASLQASFHGGSNNNDATHKPSQDMIPYKPDFQFRDPCHKCSAHNNFWRFANETLIRHPELTPEEMVFEASTNEEVPIVALLHGWDQVKAMGKLTPCWRELARIDKVIFPSMPAVERIAILRSMHLLMMYHIHPTTERFAALPSWYLLRPSQTLAHSYATDYLAWPGVRERFIFFQHRYCENTFWDLLQQEMRIRWPYELRDVYTRNVETGRYKFSQAFNERLADINVWTMGPDFFKRYPELVSDIPRWNVIPKSITAASSGSAGPSQEKQRRMSNLEERRRHQSLQIGHILKAGGEEEERRRSASVISLDALPLSAMAQQPTALASDIPAPFTTPQQWVPLETNTASPAASSVSNHQDFDAYAHAHSNFVAEFDQLMYSAGVGNGGPTFLNAPPSMSPWATMMDPNQIQWAPEENFKTGSVEEIEAT